MANITVVKNEVNREKLFRRGRQGKNAKANCPEDDDFVRKVATPQDLQRLKVEKLMSRPDREVIIPEKSKEKQPRAPLEFIRNIWGSSSGAGSGDFHVYRGVRRREYARQKFMKAKNEKEDLDEIYAKKVELNKIEADERTAKKRAKRLKKKEKLKAKKKMKKTTEEKKESSDESTDQSEDEAEESAAQE